jgi:tRNA uridine 5-carbamoylmethylation protein Kti12
MIPTELLRLIAFYLDKPFNIFYLNKKLYSIRSYAQFLPQYIRNEIIEPEQKTNEIKNIIEGWYGEKNSKKNKNKYIIDFIKDLIWIIDDIIYYNGMRRKPKKKKKQKYYSNANRKNLEKIIFNNNQELVIDFSTTKKLIRVDNIYRLPRLLILRKIKKDSNFLQFRALIY